MPCPWLAFVTGVPMAKAPPARSQFLCPFLQRAAEPATPVASRVRMSQTADAGAERNEHVQGCPAHQNTKRTVPATNMFRVDPDLIDKDPEENLRGFIKTRGSLIPGEEFVFWWTGDIYDLIDGQASRHLFSFEGYNIGRMMRVDGGWRMLTREVGLYKNRKGEILESWENPYTGERNECVHVWNDPVNQEFLVEGRSGKFKVPTTVRGDDVYWHAEVFLKYRSPLQPEEFPDNSGSEFYQSAEMFQFFSSRAELLSEEATADCMISWVRVGQWLPWMGMGDRPGRMVYHCRGRKLKGGYAELSDTVRAFVEKEHGEYASAPESFSSPNETSWTYMRKLLERRGAPRADGRVARDEPVRVELTEPSSGLRLTREELKAFDGKRSEKPIYLSVMGKVFDVSSARRHYRSGETYNCLTGRDATGAFVTGNLTGGAEFDSGCVDGLTDKERESLDGWVSFFSESYPEVGVLVDF